MDLWFTLVYHTSADAAGWDRARVHVLQQVLARPSGPALGEAEVASAVREVTSSPRLLGRPWAGPNPGKEGAAVAERLGVTTDPGTVLRAVARRLGAEIVGRPEAAVEAYAAAGLRACPPRPNAEAEELVRSLDRRGVPTVLVTNSSRPSSTWSDFLREREGPPFRQVVSSCDAGVAKPDPEIFRNAARLVGVAPPQMLHVGDRWELDVVGAQAAGCGAVLYRGLWGRYPRDLYPSLPDPPAELPGVRVLDHLTPLLDPALWAL